uniref:C2H2-type domain-containing protein n=1 Tax=Hucho hucho TaxID=62062 RepID=A0A4W5NI85_9TELE
MKHRSRIPFQQVAIVQNVFATVLKETPSFVTAYSVYAMFKLPNFSHLKMSKIELLRMFLNQRLTMAAEEIFGVVEETIVLPEQQHCEQEWSPSPGQEDPHYIQIKEEPEELESSLKNDYNHQDLTQSSLLYETQSEDYEETYCLPSTSTAQRNYSLHSTSTEQKMIQIKPELDAEDSGVSEPSRESQPLFAENTESSVSSSAAQSKNMTFVIGVESRPLSECLCGVCGIHLESTESMLDHLETHVGARVCHVCGTFFPGSAELNEHMKVHPGEKSFRCPDCGKCFRKNPDLTAHKRIHTGERPYRCQFCGKGFSQSGNLAVHMKSHSGEKPHCCPVCGKCFSSKSYMNTHMKIHTGERPFCCRISHGREGITAMTGRGFAQTGSLARHNDNAQNTSV